MDRFTSISLTVLYSLLSLGLSMSVHFCGGKPAAIKLVVTESNCCCITDMSESGCCTDTPIEVDMDLSQQIPQEFNFVPLSFDLIASWVSLDQVHVLAKQEAIDYACAPQPPPRSGGSQRLIFCSLTYFG